jgi:hypothetical protein
VTLIVETRALLQVAAPFASATDRRRLDALVAYLDEPVRIAIAGMVKSGKSTLLNALVGERIAPTDAAECTKVVTRYHHGQYYAVEGVDRAGARSVLPFERGAAIDVDLGGRAPVEFDRLDVAAPTPRLELHELVDLPGHGSTSEAGDRAEAYLSDSDHLPVDAVLYCLQHRHPSDLGFLDSFRDRAEGVGAAATIGVLSRPDEVLGAGPNSMEEATRLADSLATDPRLRSLVLGIVPVAGLLAESAATLRQEEFHALRSLALAGETTLREMRSVDDLLDGDADVLDPVLRCQLLDRLGLFGVRRATETLHGSPALTTAGLADDLINLSGIARLREVLDTRVLHRRSALRARTVIAELTALESVSGERPVQEGLERLLTGAHELREIDAVERLWSGPVTGLSNGETSDLSRLFGAHGPAVHTRLGFDHPVEDPADRILTEHARWSEISTSVLKSVETRELASLAVRTCDGLLADRGK